MSQLPFLSQFAADARFYHRLKCPQQAATSLALMVTALRSPGLWMLTFHRIIYFSTRHRNLRSVVWWLARLIEIPAHYLNTVACKSELLGDCCIKGPVYLSDKGYLTCGALSVGAGSMIHDHVTFGYAVAKGKSGRPHVGSNVWIGPNCIIAGGLEIGDGSTLLPGTYLTYSVPPRSVVRGNPGRIIREDFDNTALRATLTIAETLPDTATAPK
jgi:acetyltransferase-like isoleucine patch superfamily enzyme